MYLRGKFNVPAQAGVTVQEYADAFAGILPDTLLVHDRFGTAVFGVYSFDAPDELIMQFVVSVDLPAAPDAVQPDGRVSSEYCLAGIRSLVQQLQRNVLRDMQEV